MWNVLLYFCFVVAGSSSNYDYYYGIRILYTIEGFTIDYLYDDYDIGLDKDLGSLWIYGLGCFLADIGLVFKYSNIA